MPEEPEDTLIRVMIGIAEGCTEIDPLLLRETADQRCLRRTVGMEADKPPGQASIRLIKPATNQIIDPELRGHRLEHKGYRP